MVFGWSSPDKEQTPPPDAASIAPRKWSFVPAAGPVRPRIPETGKCSRSPCVAPPTEPRTFCTTSVSTVRPSSLKKKDQKQWDKLPSDERHEEWRGRDSTRPFRLRSIFPNGWNCDLCGALSLERDSFFMKKRLRTLQMEIECSVKGSAKWTSSLNTLKVPFIDLWLFLPALFLTYEWRIFKGQNFCAQNFKTFKIKFKRNWCGNKMSMKNHNHKSPLQFRKRNSKGKMKVQNFTKWRDESLHKSTLKMNECLGIVFGATPSHENMIPGGRSYSYEQFFLFLFFFFFCLKIVFIPPPKKNMNFAAR